MFFLFEGTNLYSIGNIEDNWIFEILALIMT